MLDDNSNTAGCQYGNSRRKTFYSETLARVMTGIMRPFSSVKELPRHSMRFLAKLASHTKKEKKSRTGSSQKRRRSTGSRKPQTPTIQAIAKRSAKYAPR